MPLNYIEKAMVAGSVEEVWTLLTEKMDSYGFDRLLYGFTRNMTASGVGGPGDLMVLSTHPPEYTRPFIDGRLFADAPMFNWAVHHTGTCSWRWM